MKIIYPKALTDEENLKLDELSVKCGILKETARLLYDRGITDYNAAKHFLKPDKSHFLDPFDLSGMKEATERICKARENHERVLVFGDYDADGICAATILCGALKIYGINAVTAVPEREEGYGLNLDRIDVIYVREGIDLIITVDCGISEAEKIALLKSRGIDVIVTDHHEPPEILPDCICINPKIKGQKYGFDGLCGGGVAYKLGFALIGEKADEFLDFAALATVADSMDLVGENRDIVAEGLKILNDSPRAVFREFLGDSGKEITAQTLAYTVAPRVNAGGRMGDANSALKLFLSEDENEIFDLSVKLNVYNATRQALCEDAFVSAKQVVSDTGANADRVILVRGGEWNAGILGIVAAKLADAYNKPAIVFSLDQNTGVYKGSARSVEGINIYDAICAVKDLLVNFGGHSQAAGLSVTEENFDALKKAVNEYAEKAFGAAELEKKIYIDIKPKTAISIRFAEEIEMLEPFGVGNRRPILATEVGKTTMSPLKENSPHYSFNTDIVEMLDFNGAKDLEILASPLKKAVVFELNLSTFKNKKSVKGFLRTVVSEFDDTDLLDVGGLSTDRNDFADAFNLLSRGENQPVKEYLNEIQKYMTDSEKRQLLFCYRVFKELGIFVEEDGVLVRDYSVKKPLDESALFRKVKEKQC
ncbi:MAG: single-stranded-DNA-specific exonuclease RecJ [Clostridia bacterium]|nr:single-stranded-DNA-specific exonuclease RecJ [Clostridia bacterium]